ncbi:hypothetical protein EHS25_004853 [Saitozyma podzolica]|uniref:Amino acid permease/ SLC12A domain-containing protein n=1 Tax=Saitozyma podzolica TaxID=1890683 RepID=A0A427Y300_9TREE|nr:hypothetical protein EHS25_004853 [Saitozyma podzolica]
MHSPPVQVNRRQSCKAVWLLGGLPILVLGPSNVSTSCPGRLGHKPIAVNCYATTWYGGEPLRKSLPRPKTLAPDKQAGSTVLGNRSVILLWAPGLSLRLERFGAGVHLALQPACPEQPHRWITVCACYTRFKSALLVQGVDRSKLLLRGCCQPYMAWAFIVSFTIILVFNGFTAFLHQFSVSDFFASYITLPVFGLCWIVFRLVKKDVIGMASLEDIELSKTDRSRRSERRGMTSQLHMPWCNRLSKEKGRKTVIPSNCKGIERLARCALPIALRGSVRPLVLRCWHT